MSNNQAFLNLYNQLDEHLRRQLNAEPSMSHAKLLTRMAAQDEVFAQQLSRLQAFRALRNALVHVPYNGEEPEPIAEPNPSVVEEYKSLVTYVLNPPRALDSVAICAVATRTWADNVHAALSVMLENAFRLMPIVVSENLVGLFDLSSLSAHVHKEVEVKGCFSLDRAATFDRFADLISFDRQDPENQTQAVPGVHFAPAGATVQQIEAIFRDCFRQNQLVSVVCITDSGRAFEPLLGIVTAHDLPSANGYIVV